MEERLDGGFDSVWRRYREWHRMCERKLWRGSCPGSGDGPTGRSARRSGADDAPQRADHAAADDDRVSAGGQGQPAVMETLIAPASP
jgi:hypothetical protein